MDLESQKKLYDTKCKEIIAEKYIAANILKAYAEEFKELSIEEIATRCLKGTPAIASIPVFPLVVPNKVSGKDSEPIGDDDSEVTFDAVIDAVAPPFDAPIQIILDFEPQNKFYPGYPILKRSIFYAASLIHGQYGKSFNKSHYEKIRKVYSIWICPYPPKKQEYCTNIYQTTETHLSGNFNAKREHYDLITVITICLGSKSVNELTGIYRMLNALFIERMTPNELRDILENEYSVRLTPKLEKGMKEMCNLSEGLCDRARIDQLTASVKSLMETTSWSLQKAMEALKISPAEQQRVATMLG